MIKECLQKNWNYIKSWQTPESRLYGIIATYWDSSETCTLPHVMNHFPVIEGFCLLHKKFPDGQYKEMAGEYAGFLMESFNRKTLLFENAWGDIPGKHTGVVHQAASAGALLDVYAITQDEMYLRTALESLSSCLDKWPGLLMNGVANQVLKFIQAACKLKMLERREFSEFYPHIKRYITELQSIVVDYPSGARLLDQSAYSGLLMTVYEAKCLHGLLALIEADIERTWALSLSESMIKGIIEKFYAGEGLFLSHIDYRRNAGFYAIKNSAAVLRRFNNNNILIEQIRRRLLKEFGNHELVRSPVWVARIADLAFIFRRMQRYINMDISYILQQLDLLFERKQLPHGGLPNAVGIWQKPDDWQNVVCSTRWNAYVFRYFCQCVDESPIFENTSIDSCEWQSCSADVYEDHYQVHCRLKANDREIIWHKPASAGHSG